MPTNTFNRKDTAEDVDSRMEESQVMSFEESASIAKYWLPVQTNDNGWPTEQGFESLRLRADFVRNMAPTDPVRIQWIEEHEIYGLLDIDDEPDQQLHSSSPYPSSGEVLKRRFDHVEVDVIGRDGGNGPAEGPQRKRRRENPQQGPTFAPVNAQSPPPLPQTGSSSTFKIRTGRPGRPIEITGDAVKDAARKRQRENQRRLRERKLDAIAASQQASGQTNVPGVTSAGVTTTIPDRNTPLAIDLTDSPTSASRVIANDFSSISLSNPNCSTTPEFELEMAARLLGFNQSTDNAEEEKNRNGSINSASGAVGVEERTQVPSQGVGSSSTSAEPSRREMPIRSSRRVREVVHETPANQISATERQPRTTPNSNQTQSEHDARTGAMLCAEQLYFSILNQEMRREVQRRNNPQ